MTKEIKIVVCSKCGKKMRGLVPANATGITCFACYNAAEHPYSRDTLGEDC